MNVIMWQSCKPRYKNPHIIIESQYGDIEVELFPDKAPKSVAAFLSYIDSGYYKKQFVLSRIEFRESTHGQQCK